MDCEDFREALSARLDDEDDSDHPADAHLDHCADCAGWYDTAALITRRTRTTAAVTWPDVSDAVLARVPPTGLRSWQRVRLALGAVGALQCGTGLVTLTMLPGAGYETGAGQLALGVALGAVAVWRLSPTALLPLLGTLVAVLGWGQVTGVRPAGLVSLGLAAAGLVLVVLLDRMPPVRRHPVPPRPAANRLRRPAESPNRDNTEVAYLTIHLTGSSKTA